jgi:pimeloyl-ACP methyl ester carboxylesterase
MHLSFFKSGLLSLAVAAVIASPTPGLLSNLLSNSKGFSLPTISNSAGGKATCISGNVAVKASASNTKLNLQSPANQYASTELFVEYFQATSGLASSSNGGKMTVSGTYNINAKLCYPTSSTANVSTIQFLIHGINFDKLYWDIPGQSYLDAAAAAGYATFSFDRLGTGLSDHPDPIQVVQSALQVEIAHQMIQSLRSGAIGGNAFQNVVGIGHSYGSIQSVGLAAQYPNDLDAIILQGFTLDTANLPATIATFNPTIASQNDPLRFGSLPSGYQVVNSAVSDQTAFMRYPQFSSSLFSSLNSKKQTFTLGDFFTLTGPVAPAAAFTGPVDIVNGQNDFIFCASDCGYPSDLGAQVLPALFPAAATGSTSYLVPGTGHGINAHTTTSQTYAQMLAFVKSAGL